MYTKWFFSLVFLSCSVFSKADSTAFEWEVDPDLPGVADHLKRKMVHFRFVADGPMTIPLGHFQGGKGIYQVDIVSTGQNTNTHVTYILQSAWKRRPYVLVKYGDNVNNSVQQATLRGYGREDRVNPPSSWSISGFKWWLFLDWEPTASNPQSVSVTITTSGQWTENFGEEAWAQELEEEAMAVKNSTVYVRNKLQVEDVVIEGNASLSQSLGDVSMGVFAPSAP